MGWLYERTAVKGNERTEGKLPWTSPLSRPAHMAKSQGTKRKGTPLNWSSLAAIDPNMTRVARMLAGEYGYPLELPSLEAQAQLAAVGAPVRVGQPPASRA